MIIHLKINFNFLVKNFDLFYKCLYILFVDYIQFILYIYIFIYTNIFYAIYI